MPTVTALDKFRDRECLTIGIFNECAAGRVCRKLLGRPLVSEPKISRLSRTNLASNILVFPFAEKAKKTTRWKDFRHSVKES